MNSNVILVDIIGDVVKSMTVPGISNINYEPGRAIQIMQGLNSLDNSITQKSKKYPLIALILPVRETFTSGYYCDVRIDRIVIATLTVGTDTVIKRYGEHGTYKSILYPCYYEFLRCLANHKNVLVGDPSAFKHTKMDNPGVQPIGQGTTDYIDSIEILNLEFTLSQIKTC